MNLSAPSRAHRGQLAGFTAAGAMLAALALAGAPAASAADDFLQLSLDGKTYTPTVAEPLFTQTLVYVPGSSDTASLWIRNNSREPAVLSSAVVVVRSAPELAGYLGLQAGTRADPSLRTSLGGQGTCADVSRVWNLDAGENVQLDFVVDLSIDAPNETRNRTAEFDIVLLLESDAAEQEPRAACDALTGAPGPTPPSGPTPPPGQPLAVTPISRDAGFGAVTPDLPAGSGAGNAGLAVVSGTPGTAGTGSTAIGAAAMTSAETPAQPSTERGTAALPPAGVMPAGFHSTVEPIIRSLSGTLLIAMAVAFAAAVVLRFRKGRHA